MCETKKGNFLIGVLKKFFGDKTDFYLSIAEFALSDAGKPILDKAQELAKTVKAAMKTPEGEALIEEYKRTFKEENI